MVAALVDSTNASAGFTLTATHANLDGCTITYTSTTGQSTEAGC